MGVVVVRYRPTSDMADINESLVRDVFEELHQKDPGTIKYATLRLADGTFLHIADVEQEANPLNNSEAFARFQDGIADRCEPGEGPSPQPASIVGSYGLFAD
ncbi:MAG: hypothetical protein KJO36_01560 [Acidimicrobiia bacterium]|nr:hypothetical protein [Acidimicrobiia bacterium]NNC44175.1 hypothetical protein [Acidimicrobiia bacterium]NNL47706.1 hypothetical protein [Acidimicrobiia bacterium]